VRSVIDVLGKGANVMCVRSLKITNFRGIKEASLRFEPGLNILIDPNNVGKALYLEQLKWF
jgi:putative ATP-dependent endonuclease of OLD family